MFYQALLKKTRLSITSGLVSNKIHKLLGIQAKKTKFNLLKSLGGSSSMRSIKKSKTNWRKESLISSSRKKWKFTGIRSNQTSIQHLALNMTLLLPLQ